MQEKINTLSERRDAGRIEVGKSRAGAVRKQVRGAACFHRQEAGDGAEGRSGSEAGGAFGSAGCAAAEK